MYFGARYYDPEVGRWLTTDPIWNTVNLSSGIDFSMLAESPYVFVSDNPLIHIDPDGKYKLRTELVAKYPFLMSAILRTEQFAKRSPKVQQIFREQVGTPVAEFVGFGIIRRDNTIKGVGKGPEITVSNLDEWTAGRTRRTIGRTDIESARWLVDRLGSDDPNVRAAAFELTKRTVLHETAHRLNKTGYAVDGQYGNKFEQEAFGEPPRTGKYDSFWEWWYNEIWPKIREDKQQQEGN